MKEIPWGQKTIQETMAFFGTNEERGLNEAEARLRREKYPNELQQDTRINPLVILLNQFTDTMVLVLLGATVISGVIGEMADAITIMAIVTINAILGFAQEYRAEKSLEEIKKLTYAQALVLRGGEKYKIASSQLVPGDIVFLQAGDKVPADIRLIDAVNFEVDEAPLTGESIPVGKNAQLLMTGDTPLAEQKNLSFMGTSVTKGRGTGVVVATGMDTVMGQIAQLMKETERSLTPLQLRLDSLGKNLIVICLVVCAVVSFLGIIRGEDIMTMLMAGISLAVAAIPEGLPAIVTIVLALGVQRMANRNAIVRKLPAVETLGCTTVICSDKTGTLTQNKMLVRKVAVFERELAIPGEEYSSSDRYFNQDLLKNFEEKDYHWLLEIACHCNNTTVKRINKEWVIEGDPTEAALTIMCHKAGVNQSYKRIREVPFDSNRKRMTVTVEKDQELLVMVKGALDVLINACHSVQQGGVVKRLGSRQRQFFVDTQEKWAKNALRVLAFAYKKIDSAKISLTDEELEQGLILVGICGMIDPPRPGVANSVAQCLSAGIVPMMITGDHPATASAIAREVGISGDGSVLTGKELDLLSDKELYPKAMKSRVFARVSPEHKNRIVKILKQNQHVVAMTGDGVNDAPAVKAADIGIAMGIAGTEVTKEASAMVLADDNFSTIVKAVYEGRAIYDNIRKFIRYLLGCNIGEVMVMFLASLLGMPLPLLPIQILWVNLVTDGLPAMALGLEPPEPGIMERKPRERNESIFARQLGRIIFSRGLFISIATLCTFTLGLIYCRFNGIEELNLPRTMAFTTLVFAQLFYVFECRSENFSPFALGFFTNKFLIAAVFGSIIMQLSVIYLPFLQAIFKTVSLLWWQWAVIILVTGFKIILRLLIYLTRQFSFKLGIVIK